MLFSAFKIVLYGDRDNILALLEQNSDELKCSAVDEKIGVDHLLRDVKDTTINTLATEVTVKLAVLKGLDPRRKEICGYLDLVID
ncbi:26S proteasome non-ATPase regulatory subunit 7 homolog A-like protein [Tanacetum coccineum]